MLKETVFVFAALVVFADATVNHCDSDTPFEDTTQISTSDCVKPTCLLKQGSNYSIEMKLVPNKDIQNLTNDIKGIFFVHLPIPLPPGMGRMRAPMGVDGTNACDNIYNVDGSKSGCPLKKGVEYVYKNSFHVWKLYPWISMVIRYALREGNVEVICFKAPTYYRIN